MPATLHGKKLTPHEHEIWRSAYQNAKQNGMDSPGAVATAAVKAHRSKGRKKFKKTL